MSRRTKLKDSLAAIDDAFYTFMLKTNKKEIERMIISTITLKNIHFIIYKLLIIFNYLTLNTLRIVIDLQCLFLVEVY